MASDDVTEPQSRMVPGSRSRARERQSRHARSHIIALAAAISEDIALKREGSLT
ncbi:hypothetical protein [Mycobacterium sp. Marseille-P9652]|uniref:hypothetical protein n=1 Tax=Mycobacterium sp. Marseille-P9652 TaxID=2654950 RepID=UPI0012E76141|nr:hypothetical protein [Mycobacterium sp. Marseille-P9652]